MTPQEIKLVVKVVFGIVAIALVFFFSPFVIVNAGHRGVVVNLGNVSDRVLTEGIHWRTPFVQSIKQIEVRTVKLDVTASAYSKDIQTVNTALTLNYHVVPDQANILYREIGSDFEARIIQPAVQESVKAALANYTAQELVELRPKVKDEIKLALSERLALRYMVVDDLSITDFSFSDVYEQAIEAKQRAQQEALKAENDLRRIELEAQQRVATAKAEAEAIRIQAQAITQQGGAEYVRLKTIEKWDGKGCTQYCGLETSTGLLIGTK